MKLKQENYQIICEHLDEKGYDETTGRLLITISDKYFRPAEVDLLLGD